MRKRQRSKQSSSKVTNDLLTARLVQTHDNSRRPTSTAACERLRTLFLPVGYPNSVRTGYLEYQWWDVIQGLTSYLRGQLAYQSMLVGLGVGDVEATASAGALSKIIRDTSSMVGSLLFTYVYSDEFGYDVRQWRLFADVSNDIGLTLHFVAPLFGKDYFIAISCVASLMTTMCGISAGATKAYISSHFALENNLTDLVAKEGSQETAVNIIGLVGGYMLLASVGTVDQSGTAVWVSFLILTVVHIFANIRAIQYLTFNYLNETRFVISFNHFVKGTMETGVTKYVDVCHQEPLLPLLPLVSWLPWLPFRRHRGSSNRTSTTGRVLLGSDHRFVQRNPAVGVYFPLKLDGKSTKKQRDLESKFVLVQCQSTQNVHVLLHTDATVQDILKGMFEAEALHRFGANFEENRDHWSQTTSCSQRSSNSNSFTEFQKLLVKQGWNLDQCHFRIGRTRYSDFNI